MKTIKVFAPATIGNIGPGFDTLGLAIKGLGDTIEAKESLDNNVIIESIENADHDISKERSYETISQRFREL